MYFFCTLALGDECRFALLLSVYIERNSSTANGIAAQMVLVYLSTN